MSDLLVTEEDGILWASISRAERGSSISRAAADLYVGSQVDWGLTFGTLPDREQFRAYAERLRSREAYKAAKAIDGAHIAKMQKS